MSLLIATPQFGGMCHSAHMMSALKLKEALHQANIDHDWLITTNESLIQRARNTAAARFLDSEYQRLLFIDADIEFEPDAVAELWNMDAEIAAGAYQMKSKGAPLSVWRDGAAVYRHAPDIEAVDYAGTGFMMIARTAFERLMQLHPEWKHTITKDGEPVETYAFFQTPVREGVQLSEDYFFCHEARKAGLEVLWNPHIHLTHWGSHGY